MKNWQDSVNNAYEIVKNMTQHQIKSENDITIKEFMRPKLLRKIEF